MLSERTPRIPTPEPSSPVTVAVFRTIKRHRMRLARDWNRILRPDVPSTPVELPGWLDADQEKEHACA